MRSNHCIILGDCFDKLLPICTGFYPWAESEFQSLNESLFYSIFLRFGFGFLCFFYFRAISLTWMVLFLGIVADSCDGFCPEGSKPEMLGFRGSLPLISFLGFSDDLVFFYLTLFYFMFFCLNQGHKFAEDPFIFFCGEGLAYNLFYIFRMIYWEGDL